MTVDLSSYKPLYIQTAREYLTQMHQGLQDLSISANPAAIESIHIAAHSLSSQSQIMNYLQIAKICKDIEVLFKSMKDGSHTAPSAEQILTLQNATTSMQNAVLHLETAGTVSDLTDVMNAVHLLS